MFFYEKNPSLAFDFFQSQKTDAKAIQITANYQNTPPKFVKLLIATTRHAMKWADNKLGTKKKLIESPEIQTPNKASTNTDLDMAIVRGRDRVWLLWTNGERFQGAFSSRGNQHSPTVDYSTYWVRVLERVRFWSTLYYARPRTLTSGRIGPLVGLTVGSIFFKGTLPTLPNMARF